ncbi:MAG: alpha/beta hydrolase [Paracoccaceae bacterium]
MRLALVIAAVICGLYLAAAGAMFAFQRQLQYFPGNRAPTPAEAGFDGAEVVPLTAADGTRIHLWYAPAPEGAPTILYFQGNGGEIGDRPKRWAFYRAAGFGVAFLSYRGYGGSEGAPSEAGLHQDADAALAWLAAQGLAQESIALVGESLGTGVAVRLAAEAPGGRRFAALVLEAPYTSTADVAARAYPWLPVRLLMRDPFPSIDRIASVRAPVFVFHGEADTTIPFDLGQRLFEAAPAPKEFLPAPGAGHEAIYEPSTWEAEARFIRNAHRAP